MTKRLIASDMMTRKGQAEIDDDFHWYISPHLWTSLATDSGTSVNPTISSSVGGVNYCFTAATDNNEASFCTTNEVFKILDGRPMVFLSRLKFIEANTDDANVAFGVADTFGANLLVDNGAGPKTSFSGALIYKVDGGTVWKCVSSIGTTQTISTSTQTAGGTSWQQLRVEISPVTSTVAEVSFWVDDKMLVDSTSLKPIKHNVTYTNGVAMALGCYVKAGGSNAEILAVDYVKAASGRGLASTV